LVWPLLIEEPKTLLQQAQFLALLIFQACSENFLEPFIHGSLLHRRPTSTRHRANTWTVGRDRRNLPRLQLVRFGHRVGLRLFAFLGRAAMVRRVGLVRIGKLFVFLPTSMQASGRVKPWRDFLTRTRQMMTARSV
jgi:hypothetical protein